MYLLRRFTPVTVAMLAVLLALAFGALAMFGSDRAEATHVSPTLQQGNFNCAQIQGLPADTIELRIEPVADGTYTDGTLTVTIDVRNTGSGQVFDFTANQSIVAVAVKGGPNTNVYNYTSSPVTEDTGLHAPAGANGRWSGLSHISFCYVVKANPTLATEAQTPVTVGDTITDTATLSGGNNPTGTVTFNLFGPDDEDCSGGSIFTSTNNVVNGSATSDPFTTVATGTYRWTADYSGDANNNGASSGCNAANEQSVVNKASSAIATEQSYIPNDSATVTGFGTPEGTVTFELFTDLTCGDDGGTSVYTEEDVALDNGTASTDNSGGAAGYTITTPGGDFSWLVTYSGDTNNEGSTSCVEESRVIIDDDETKEPNPLAALTT